MPALIIQGSNDIQVGVNDAKLLKAAKPDAELALIEGMNHVMRIVPNDVKRQLASCKDPNLPLAAELVRASSGLLTDFAPAERDCPPVLSKTADKPLSPALLAGDKSELGQDLAVMTDTQTSPDTTAEKDVPPAVELPWADVHVEHHKMLRLAPLQTDRNTGGRPLRFVEFGYAERNNKEHSLMRMSIALPGQRVRKEQNHLDVWVDHTTKRVHFGPDSGLQIEPTEPWHRPLHGRARHQLGEKTLAGLHRRRH